MREGWVETTLGAVATRVIGRTPQRKTPRYWTSDTSLPFFTIADMRHRTVTAGREGVTQEAVDSGQAKRVPAGSLLLSFKLSIGKVAITDRDVYPNEAIAWLQPGPKVTRDFLALAMEHVAWEDLGGRAVKGKTMNTASLDAVKISLPPLDEQRRIVDLIGAVDDAIDAATASIETAQEARGFLLEGLLGRLPDETPVAPLGEVGTFIRGRRFVKSDYVEEGLGCIHYGQIHTSLGSVTTETLTFIPEEMRTRMRLASSGDVVIAATSEDVSGLGKATVWLGTDDVAVHDDCQIFKHQLDSRYATHLFVSENFNRQKVQYAAGMKVTRISGADLARIRVPVPAREDQEKIGAVMSNLDECVAESSRTRDTLRTLRANLLTALLSGEHEIPESYDQITVEEVA